MVLFHTSGSTTLYWGTKLPPLRLTDAQVYFISNNAASPAALMPHCIVALLVWHASHSIDR